MRQRTHAEQAFGNIARQVAGMSPEEVPILLGPAPEIYKARTRASANVPGDPIVQQAKANMLESTDEVDSGSTRGHRDSGFTP